MFSLYSEVILWETEDLPGLALNGYNVNNICYADDAVLIADSEGLQELLNKVIEESEELGLSINTEKHFTMTSERNQKH